MLTVKRLVLAAGMFACVSIPLFASGVRDMGMGLYEYPWMMDGSRSYYLTNPAFLLQYRNEAFFERVGALDGMNMGAVVLNLSDNMNLAVNLGAPVDSTVWNGTTEESLFHKGNYSIKSVSGRTPVGADALEGFQEGMLNGTIIDLMDPTRGSRVFTSSATTSDDIRNELDQKNVGILWAMRAGSLSLGLNFGYATSWSNERYSDVASNSNDEYNFINTQYDVALGMVYQINPGMSIDFAGKFAMYMLSAEYEKSEPGIATKMTYSSDGAMDGFAQLRLNMAVSQKHVMHIKASYSYLNRSTAGDLSIADDTIANDDADATDDFYRLGSLISFGMSDEINAGSIRAYAGFEIQYKSFKNEYSGTDAVIPARAADTYENQLDSIMIPIMLGLEAQHNENWTTRYGLITKIYQPVTNTGDNVTNSGADSNPTSYSGNSSSKSDIFAGITWKKGDFTFDWLANLNIFTAGPYFVSGKSATGSNVPLAMSMAFAGTYSFDSLLSGKTADATAVTAPVTDDANRRTIRTR